MGVAKYMKATWNKPKLGMSKEARRNRMSSWRKEGVFQRIERPTRIDAARRVGYKAKQGIVLVRTRVRRGGLRKGKIHMKRKPSNAGIKKITMAKSIQRIAEERVSRRYPNLEVLTALLLGRRRWKKQILRSHTHRPTPPSDKIRQTTKLGIDWFQSLWQSIQGQDISRKEGTRSTQQGQGS